MSYDADSWEPRTADKGPIARAMFCMAVRYDGTDPDVPDLELAEIPNARHSGQVVLLAVEPAIRFHPSVAIMHDLTTDAGCYR